LQPSFATSCQKELDRLITRGVFGFINMDQIPTAARIFNSRFVDRIKFAGTSKAYEKSRLVIQAYNDNNKRMVLT
jgi:hypothetical protein